MWVIWKGDGIIKVVGQVFDFFFSNVSLGYRQIT